MRRSRPGYRGVAERRSCNKRLYLAAIIRLRLRRAECFSRPTRTCNTRTLPYARCVRGDKARTSLAGEPPELNLASMTGTSILWWRCSCSKPAGFIAAFRIGLPTIAVRLCSMLDAPVTPIGIPPGMVAANIHCRNMAL